MERQYSRPGSACTAAQKSSERHSKTTFFVYKRDQVLRYVVTTEEGPGELVAMYKHGLEFSAGVSR